MTKLKDKVSVLNELIKSGETLQAMEIFYSDSVEMQENEDIPRKGKPACIDAETKNLQKVKSFKSNLLNQVIDEEKGIIFSEWEILVTYKDSNKSMLKQVSVQHWLDGQVVKEKFYYKNFYKVD